jgi:two-component system, NtrC family, response regulator HydG
MSPLRGTTRQLLQLTARAVFANPFGEERRRLDLELSHAPAALARGEVVDRVLARVDRELAALGGRRPVSIEDYAGEDRELVELGILFALFHRHADAFDTLIRAESAADERPLPVEFARQAFADFAAHGFSDEEARRSFAIFWQMRRAFHFIEHSLTGECPSMVRLRESLWNNVFTCDLRLYARLLHRSMEDFSTFLVGETGTGKGTAAAAIGRSGFIAFDARRGRFSASFVDAFLAINLSAFPPSLIESELFGHEKGAFTGAIERHQGVFERALAHGSIFLDEIGEVDATTQIKLLNVLQERSFRPVGSHRTLRFEGRVIAATNRDVASLRQSGRFREDFFYRLCSDVIELPPLRQRIAEDRGELRRLLGDIVRGIVGEDDAALVAAIQRVVSTELPADYAWPGNVRELEQCARRVLVTRHYRPEPRAAAADANALLAATGDGSWSADDLLARYCGALWRRLGSYEAVAERIGVDRRTVKRYVLKDEAVAD